MTRGVKVHALIAHTSGGGQKRLRKLELEMLNAGVTVSRTDDDLLRYHYKMLLIDRDTLYALGIQLHCGSTSRRAARMAVATKNKAIVSEAIRLFEADSTRQPYTAEPRLLSRQPGERAHAALASSSKARRKSC